MTGSRVVHVLTEGSGGSYPVLVGRGVLPELPGLLRESMTARSYVVISDETVARIHGARVMKLLADGGLDGRLLTFPAGEKHKTRAMWSALTDGMLEVGVGRDGAVVSLGGGVTGDLAGFVAATYMRGIPVAHVPTSLVAMIDASVGGKTGVDLPAGKNLVGAFHPPRFVLADAELAATLSIGERAQGLAEAIKHGAILDRAYFEAIGAGAGKLLEGDPEAVVPTVLRSVELKADVVTRDEREEGLRRILNFGHTLGHALEAAAGYRLPHGSAISIGMVLEAKLGEAVGVTEAGTWERLAEILERLGLPVGLPPWLDAGRVLAHVGADKKAREGRPRFVLLAGIGRVAASDSWVHEVSRSAALEVLEGGESPSGSGR